MTDDRRDGPRDEARADDDESRRNRGGRFAGAEDVASILGLALVVLVLIGAPLALIRTNDDTDTTTDIRSALADSSVVLPSESESFGIDREAERAATAAACGEGRIDLLTADEADINAVRGLRQTQTAALVAANREIIQEPVDLVRVGISEALVSRIFLSREACIGGIRLDDTLPTGECGVDDLDVNTAFPSELHELQGIDEEQAQLLVDNAPFTDIMQIVAIDGIAERTITWLALNDTCLYSIRRGNAEPDGPPRCSERVDLNNATVEQIMGVRGLHQVEAAEVVATNAEAITSVADLVELGLDPGRLGRFLASHEACFGNENPDDQLPGTECAAGATNLNTATVIDLLDIEGITHDTADLLVFYRPFTTVDEIAAIPQLEDATLTWLAVASTCLGDEAATGDLCDSGRIDITTASLDQLIQIRGLRRQSVASSVFANQAGLDGLVSLLDVGIGESAAGKFLGSRQACIGDRLPEDDLPSANCGPISTDLNTADIVKLIELPGVTHLQADLLIANRPYVNPSDLLSVRGIDPVTVTRLALLEACVEQESEVDG